MQVANEARQIWISFTMQIMYVFRYNMKILYSNAIIYISICFTCCRTQVIKQLTSAVPINKNAIKHWPVLNGFKFTGKP